MAAVELVIASVVGIVGRVLGVCKVPCLGLAIIVWARGTFSLAPCSVRLTRV